MVQIKKKGLPFYLNHPVVDGRVLLLPEHNQSDDDDGRYDNASNHEPDNSTLIGPDVLREQNLRGNRTSSQEVALLPL